MNERNTIGWPLVSIGLPVYNGEDYLEEALDSLLNLEYPNLEIIICDNCSTDQTSEIIANYTFRDERIRPYQNEKNLGPTPNFQRVVDLAAGEFFLWAAHDDLWEVNSVSHMVNELQEYPDAILATPRTKFIEENGTIAQHATDRPAPGDSSLKNLSVFYEDHACSWIYGVFRTDWIKEHVGELDNYICHGGDILWLVDIINRFPVIGAPEALIIKRLRTQKLPSDQKEQSWLEISKRLSANSWHSPQSFKTRLVATWYAWKYTYRKSRPHGQVKAKISHFLSMLSAVSEGVFQPVKENENREPLGRDSLHHEIEIESQQRDAA